MKQLLNNNEVKFLEYLQGGELPAGKEEWIILKARIEQATYEAFQRQALIDVEYYGDNQLVISVRF